MFGKKPKSTWQKLRPPGRFRLLGCRYHYTTLHIKHLSTGRCLVLPLRRSNSTIGHSSSHSIVMDCNGRMRQTQRVSSYTISYASSTVELVHASTSSPLTLLFTPIRRGAIIGANKVDAHIGILPPQIAYDLVSHAHRRVSTLCHDSFIIHLSFPAVEIWKI